MCKPETLHHNEHGYVSWCRSCNYLSIAFGNMMMALLDHQIKGFISVVSLDIINYRDKICSEEKAFIYNTDSPHVKIVMNYIEIEKMYDLLNSAMLMLEIKKLLLEKHMGN